ncbi:hypothetical protein K4K51_010205 [Colletotrichum sp. SAR 10_75]|nr:hypothetical protein K4K51_010205 [Colletotrichum sp. SAR 10_75]
MVAGTTTHAASAALTRDEFIDLRNVQDRQINAELSSIRQALGDNTHELKVDIHRVHTGLTDDINTVHAELKNDIYHVHATLTDDINNVRTELKEDINNVRTELKEDINNLRTELKDDMKDLRTELKDDMKDLRTELKDDMKDLRTELKSDIDLLRAEFERGKAFNHNSRLRNPTLRIEPLAAIHPDGPVLPDKRLFPKDAKTFYGLRVLTSARRVEALAYLVKFYDIPFRAWHANDDDDYDYESYESDADEDSDDGSKPAEQPELSLEEAVLTYPKRAVEDLETILGLNEENFINFRAHARQLKLESLVAKRPAESEQRPRPAPSRRVYGSLFDQKASLQPSRPIEQNSADWEKLLKEGQEKEASEKSEETRILWDNGSFRRRNQDKMRNLAERGARSSEGSPTNADTLSREGRSPRPQTPV